MPPKRRAAPKSKKVEENVVEGDNMSRITVRRKLKNNESENLKDEEHEVLPLQVDTSENNSDIKAMVVLEKMPDIDYKTHDSELESEEIDKQVDSNKKSVLKKNVLSKVTKADLKKKAIDGGKILKKTRKRAASEDRQTSIDEEKVVSSRSKKRPVEKDSSEPPNSHLSEPLKRNRRAASVDILNKISSSAVPEPKKIRKAKKGSATETTEDLAKKTRRSSSLDSLDLNTSPVVEEPVVQKKSRKATKAVVETVDKKVLNKKEKKFLGRNKKEEKNISKVMTDEKENINILPPLEQTYITEEIKDKVKSTTALTKEEILENLEMEDVSEKVPKQINSRSQGKKQIVSKSKPIKSNEKTDIDDSDILRTSEQSTEEQNLEVVEDSPEKILQPINSKSRGKKQVTQKKNLKTNKSSEESSDKSNNDDSDKVKSPEIKPKRNVKQKEVDVDQEIKFPKRRARNAKNDDLEAEEILGNDENVKTEDSPENILSTPESEKLFVPIKVKRKAKAKPAKK